MPSCPHCGGAIEESHAFCPHCGKSLAGEESASREAPAPRARQGGTATPVGRVSARPVMTVSSAQPVTPSGLELDEERTLLQRARPVVWGIVFSFGLGLVYMFFSLNVAKNYTPLLDFYQRLPGLIWPAILMVGAAWAGKDERENSFIFGAVTGAVSGLLLAFCEDALHGGKTMSLRHTMGGMLLGVGVGVVGATVSGLLGSPMLVRLPNRQKQIALGLFIGLIALVILTISLPPEPADHLMDIGTVYYTKASELRDGENYFHKDLLRLARDYFEMAVERDPRLANAHNNLAVVLQELGDEEGALRNWRQAQLLDATLPEPYKNLGTVYLERGLREGNQALIEYSIEQYRRYLQISPTTDLNTLYNLVLALRELGDREGALTIAREAAQMAPQDSRIQRLVQDLSQPEPEASPEVPDEPSSSGDREGGDDGGG